jgi:hypothetical protein
MKRRPLNRWQVLADTPGWQAPLLVDRFPTEAEARLCATALNLLAGEDRPLYFVELWETFNVLDIEHSREKV